MTGDRKGAQHVYVNHTNDPAGRCPVCGGPTDEVQVPIGFWRGGVEPTAVLACADSACDAYYPAIQP
jgi:hypothetical protein